ncbi:MAG TPA: hypothetical protein VE967_12390 [Gemmatimonadaceae bacterium]|nr:hypothetical protein [Gemmatimonadaceae bacterium]
MAAGVSPEARTDYGEIVVVGGGCYGSYYVRQLGRAAAAGAITWERLTVVDRNTDCPAKRTASAESAEEWAAPAPQFIAQEWGEFFDNWLGTVTAGDAIVPSPLMPHLFFEYIARTTQRRWPGRAVSRAPLPGAIGTPWEQAAPDGTAYVSHATWTCPVNCIEPRICPHTRGLRDWTMPATLAAWADSRRAVGETVLGPFTFHCTHRAYGVGMVDAAPIHDAEQAIASAAREGEVRALVATASHCHGAAAMLAVGPVGSGRERERERGTMRT